MAQYPQEHLEKLLKFLNDEIIHDPANAWFVDKLYKLLPQKEIPPTSNPDIKNIEKYLALDYKIDTLKTHIDYSFIKDNYLRDCFEADWREMLRYRFGTRGHNICFPEFCRYVLIQAERALNVYYNTVFEKDFQKIKENITLHADWVYIPDKVNNVESISFAAKLDAFVKALNLKKEVKDVLDRVREVRNTTSHGSSIPDFNESFFQKHYKQLISQGYPLTSFGLVDWAALKKNEQLNNIYNNFMKQTPEHQLYIKLAWQRQCPFDEVMLALGELVKRVSSILQ
ncbi:MAG: hypothetical protein J1E29_00535 [Duncaniella sp.]|nr:hypothetical protein [Duncaniella sp.]